MGTGRVGIKEVRDVRDVSSDPVYRIKTYSCASCSVSRGSGVGWSLLLFARREKSELSDASDLELDTRDLRGELGSVVTRAESVLNMMHAIEGEMGGVIEIIVGGNNECCKIVLRS